MIETNPLYHDCLSAFRISTLYGSSLDIHVPKRRNRQILFSVRDFRQENPQVPAVPDRNRNWWYRFILPPDGILLQLAGP